jgi:ubiquinone/menaquinone biosynthesis C-methylase UbiE
MKLRRAEVDTQFWQEWWDRKAARLRSDIELDRGVTRQPLELERRATQRFLAALRPASTDCLLDVGCGTGVNLERVAPLVDRAIGIDLSEGMLRRARMRMEYLNLANVALVHGNVADLKFQPNSFDKVICTSVTQYLGDNDCQKALQEMVRVAKPGAILILHIKNSRSLYGLSLRVAKPLARWCGRNAQPDVYRSAAWYEKWLDRFGASVIDYDSFGIFTFVPLSRPVVDAILHLEVNWIRSRWLKRFGVNYHITAQVREKTES